MKSLLTFTFITLVISAQAQLRDSILIKKAATDYLEGFYEGDTLKLQRSLNPMLYKYGYWQTKTGTYEGEQMTYAQAIDYAKEVAVKKHFAKEGSPKEVYLLDIQSQIACAKVIAWWGLDYLLLSKKGDHWMIDQVIWQGPLKTVMR